ncbi:Unknown protein sequence [Pseudomonas syringae pv. maculicola]|nr:Unknown protein sequence [Pseudomonas syringae pv. maculicola]
MDISFHRYFLGLTRRHPTLLLNTARKWAADSTRQLQRRKRTFTPVVC